MRAPSTGRLLPCYLNNTILRFAITNFFSQVAALDLRGCLNLPTRKDGENLTVSLSEAGAACKPLGLVCGA